MALHPLLSTEVRWPLEQAVSQHLGRPWTCTGCTDLAERSSHPAAVLRGPGLAVFAKLLIGPAAVRQACSELAGLALLQARSGVRVPVPVGEGMLDLAGRALLVTEAVVERVPAERTPADWADIGRALTQIHAVHGQCLGLDADGYFGPLHQDNRAVPSNTWSEFYGERRVLPWLALAYEKGQLDWDQVRQIERIVARLPELGGPEPEPTLLHGDAQHHNFVSTASGAVVIDASPYYGHPELDLALVDYFTAVPPELVAAYAEFGTLDPGFTDRRELWRIFAYLGILAVDGDQPWSRGFARRLSAAIDQYA